MKNTKALNRGRMALRIVLISLVLLALCATAGMAEVKSAVVTRNTRIFQSPSTSARSLPVSSGTQVNLHGVRGDWALVERGGVYAYMYAGHVSELNQSYTDRTPVYVTSDTRVYQSPSTASASLPVSKGMKIYRIAVNGNWAMVENGGVYAYINASQISETEPEQGSLPYDPSKTTPVYITVNTRVYQSPSTSSASLAVPAGMKVNLVAVNGDWAMVENGGVFAYISASQIADSPSPTPTPQPDYESLLANAKDAVITASTRVYQSPSASAASLPAPAGMKVRLLAVNGDWALIENSGAYAYINAAQVALVPDVQPTPEPEQPDYSSLLPGAKPAIINTDTLAYKFADLSSSSVSIAKGTQVKLLAVNDGWALIECNGNYGFTNAAHVSEATQPTPTPEPAGDDYFASPSYSNEQKCYLFMTREMGLNSAAAAGVLANIYKESSFNPACGSSFYGLCQWGGGRLTKLKDFCSGNGYSVSSLEGQLRFMWHELKNSYPSVLKTLQSVDNTADGAYTAGYQFCYFYEIPANRTGSSEARGALARDTYFPRYS